MFRVVAYGLGLHVHDRKRSLSEVQGGHDGVLDSLRVLLRRFETVDDQFYEMGLVAVQRSDFVEFAELAVDADLCVSSLAHLLEQFLVVSLTASYEGSEQIAFAACVVFHNQRDNLLVSVADHSLACLGRVCCRRLGIEKSHEVVDLCDGADCRARVVACGLLLDGNDRAQSCNGLHLRFFQYAHKVFCVGGEGVHVPSLSLRIDCVECK